jgi:soluble lytic murein transglycosylase-like protein
MKRTKLIAQITVKLSVVLLVSHLFARGILTAESYMSEQYAFASARVVHVVATRGGYKLPQDATPTASTAPLNHEDIAEREALRHKLNPALVRALMKVESSNNQYAVSSAGALGLMQIMPQNAKRCGLNWLQLASAEHNIACGAQILAENMRAAKDDVVNALRLYNGGPDCVGGGCKESEKHWRLVLAAMAKDVRG